MVCQLRSPGKVTNLGWFQALRGYGFYEVKRGAPKILTHNLQLGAFYSYRSLTLGHICLLFSPFKRRSVSAVKKKALSERF